MPRKMFEDYRNQLIEFYKQGCTNSKFSNNLMNPTPAKLRRECLIVHTRVGSIGYDQRTLSDFFGQPADLGNFENLIKHFDVDKFRPLNNFLLGKTTDPDERNIELLAWLMDFKPRPYRFEDFNEPDITLVDLPEAAKSNRERAEEPIPFLDQHKIERKRNLSVLGKWFLPIVGLSALIVISSFFFFLGDAKSGQQCMYWSKDHYEAIDCNKRIFGKQSIALDTLMLLHFKKITQPDTITDKSLGKIWYVKTGGKLEFFTADGFHPIYRTKPLKPISSYLIHKYCNRK